MNSSNRLLDLYMQKLSMRTLAEVANKLGVTRPAVSNWRAGTSHPNAEAIESMCKATGEPLSRWLPLIEAERCRTEGDRKVWLRLAQAAAAIFTAFLMLRHGVDTHAVSAFVVGAPIHYAKLSMALAAGTTLAYLVLSTHGKRQCHAAAHA